MSRSNSNILAIARCGRQFRDEAMVPLGLRGCHIGYLTRICAEPGISQDTLAQNMLLNKSNIARQAAFLEENGFITRTPSPTDKRLLQLYPTEKALALLPEMRDTVSQWDSILFQDITDSELETVTQLLEKMRRNAAQWMEGR